jgi:hypothetical protein
MVRMRDGETQSPLSGDRMHQIKQGNRVRASGDGDHRPTGSSEQARTGEVATDAVHENIHVV